MTELENKLVEKIMEKLDMDKLTDKIAEKAAELIVQKEYPSTPITNPSSPWIAPQWPDKRDPFGPVTVMYGVTPTEFRPMYGINSAGEVTTFTGNKDKVE